MKAVAVGSTMYGGAVPGMELEFKGISVTVAELGLSLYVLGFAFVILSNSLSINTDTLYRSLGPLVWVSIPLRIRG